MSSGAWGLDKTVLKECGADCPDPTNFTRSARAIHAAKQLPNIPFGLIDDTGDSVIAEFFGFGANMCAASLIPTPLTAATYTAGLLDARAKVAPYLELPAALIFDRARPTRRARRSDPRHPSRPTWAETRAVMPGPTSPPG